MDIDRARACKLLFGKHKDKPLSEVPLGYLRWLEAEGIRSDYLREAVEAVLAAEDKDEAPF